MTFSEKYNLIHKGEIIDFFYTREEAEKMKVEYEMAFKSPIKIEYWYDEEAALAAEQEYIETWANNIDTNLL
tara:strand:+ start:548 stop:763 length:216 start_codon:yes stop_codon:yes gene_type:complete